MYRLAAALTRNCPSLALFAGGGEVAVTEMLHNVAQKREIILIAGSGGVTDTVAAACAGGLASDERIAQIVREGRITLCPLDRAPLEVSALIRGRLLYQSSQPSI
jgi:hypothetical protein